MSRARGVASLVVASFIASAFAAAPPGLAAPAVRDGGHDFDFDVGTWRTSSSRLVKPLTGSTTWTELEGTTVVRPVWGGKANLAEFRADGASGPLELLSLRWYTPSTGQWNLGFATPGVGTLGAPSIGVFANGRGDFYSHEPVDGRHVLVRFSIWAISRDSARSEQAFSVDGGRTWEVNWINRYTRLGA